MSVGKEHPHGDCIGSTLWQYQMRGCRLTELFEQLGSVHWFRPWVRIRKEPVVILNLGALAALVVLAIKEGDGNAKLNR
jgi:hypothetical protein